MSDLEKELDNVIAHFKASISERESFVKKWKERIQAESKLQSEINNVERKRQSKLQSEKNKKLKKEEKKRIQKHVEFLQKINKKRREILKKGKQEKRRNKRND